LDDDYGGFMVTITNEDCMALMGRYHDKYFDLAIVDPPYGLGAERGTGPWARAAIICRKKWDVRPNQNYFNELLRVSDNQIIFGGNYFNLPIRRCWICWYKSDEVKGRTFAEIELAWTSFDTPARHYTEKPFIKSDLRVHPTQKPVGLYKWLLSKYAKPGYKILDTHLGSGSIAIACIDFFCDLTACEIDEDYYKSALKRIAQYQKNQNLFDKDNLYG
jgi:site-specific DNA-methyltransferase (adenine-specific)